MSTAMVSIQLPDTLFRKLKRTADLTHRPVEEIAATSLLRRAKAMAILAQRGHDLSDFLRVPYGDE